MEVVLIAAVAENFVIGAQGKMPWHLSEDLKRFKRLTMGTPILMGRKTWESIGRALPGRENVVISRRTDYAASGAVVVASLEEALAAEEKKGTPVVHVIGGGEIYAQAIARAHRLELTLVHQTFDGDVRFPAWAAEEWRETLREEHVAVAAEGAAPLRYSFITLVRK